MSEADFSLIQLRGFIAVAQEQHVGRAAARLGMTQPPLTRQIQALERSLGIALFDRTGRGLSLTEAGRTFLVDACRVVDLADAAPAAARRIAAGDSGTLRLGFTAIAAFAVLAEVLAAVSELSTAIHVELTEQVSQAQCEAVRAGVLDLAVVRPPVPDDLVSTRIHVEDVVVAVPQSDARWGGGTEVSLAEVAAGRTGYSPEGDPQVRGVCAALLPVDDLVQGQVTTQVSTMLALVGSGHARALVPRSCAAMQVEGVRFCELAAADRQQVELWAAWRESNTNPVLQRLVPVLRARSTG
ncbi:MAG TPA: LysR family transcriptional regulator [Candidatus Avipropionibacterium avicola]|uniref:LysR family transcriptional regulator n=1 Tax=Candidatus Avipropionibacterium avicola TaxID=2840701 RepID=A0A9D1GW05_9ACTN|nr:LysR family transcriptional regulator [Candidatus Avipropionibacterium avicola]